MGISEFQTDELRYEFKFVVKTNVVSDLDLWLRLHPSMLRKQHPSRQINNVYFDTYDHALLWESEQGLQTRTKYRMRWYGWDRVPRDFRLEIKSKFGNMTSKRVTPVEIELPGEGELSWAQLRHRIAHHCDWIDRLPIALHPVMANSYRREYLVTADASVRVTIDTKQRFYEVERGSVLKMSNIAWEDTSVIVEVKAGPESEDSLRAFTEQFPVRVGRNSKFVNGVRSVLMQ